MHDMLMGLAVSVCLHLYSAFDTVPKAKIKCKSSMLYLRNVSGSGICIHFV
jgi:hypothetical protein